MPLFAFGSNGHGQLGLGHQEDCHQPAPCPFTAKSAIASITGGGNHTLLITASGELWAVGAHDAGQLGLPSSADTTLFAPATVPSGLPREVMAAAGGWTHSVLLSTQHQVWTCGANRHGQCGIDSGDDDKHAPSATVAPSPIAIADLVRVHHIAAGLRTSWALSADGLLYGWGCNRHGRLNPSLSARNIMRPTLLALPPSLGRAVAVACGQRHTVIVANHGRSLYCLGDNRWHQLGSSDEAARTNLLSLRDIAPHLDDSVTIVEIGAGWSHTIVRLSNGEVWAWGRGDRGQLGVALPADARRRRAEPVRVALPSAAVAIAVGSEHALALLDDDDDDEHRCFAWGWNEHGNCGLGHTDDVYTPVEITWPSPPGRIRGIGAGYGTSFVWARE
ncbi:regulator of chromosome condensation 1/beta-lactamase-inhibitor protein II [Syncephalis pseudoplumigaleata]|uniref:Regulator of chromosome condensation 1/beta-lactamase-inhibitor protein II n=1 Tax=Syncephalis pseudoplumigaleata TaxID=1712513 RepID=A0A4P9Z584_9FUNG|nr:regulator of chromosome condensation 1/beta-lactamase-inhibitor protein II [Syncephalis pseudoplumigaleata]|eukprot:RKP27608.1 regulator of chromosome condensation 1/beta-lactamase-inhibitor protein II [Syncephalis pseudoplumigaleata]